MNKKYEFFIAGRARNKDNILEICDEFVKLNISVIKTYANTKILTSMTLVVFFLIASLSISKLVISISSTTISFFSITIP